MELRPASAIKPALSFAFLFRPPKLSENASEDGFYQLILAPQGFSLLNLNRLALGALAFSTQYYLFHDNPGLVRYLTHEMWVSTIVLSLLGLWSVYAGINGLSESQKLEFRDGEILFLRDRLFFPQQQSFSAKGLAALRFQDKTFFRDRILAMDVPVATNWEGDQIFFFEYASVAEKRKALGLVDRQLITQ